MSFKSNGTRKAYMGMDYNNNFVLQKETGGSLRFIADQTYIYGQTYIKKTTDNLLYLENNNPSNGSIVKFGAVSSNNKKECQLQYESNFGLFDHLNGQWRMTINNSGDVGIGTTSPQAKLDVNGDIWGSSFAIPGSSLLIKPSGSNDLFLYFAYNFRMASTTNDRVIIGAKTITSGTHNTSDVKLTVDGHAIFKKVIVTQSNWADFVFAKDYKLKPLAEVESYIAENKHLPDVPSEAEVIDNGISLGDMDAILLQKIEELTLYMIQLEKKNQELEKEINKLKKLK